MEEDPVVMYRDGLGGVWSSHEEAQEAAFTHTLIDTFRERFYPEVKAEALKTIRVQEAMTAIAKNPKLMIEVLEVFQKLSGK